MWLGGRIIRALDLRVPGRKVAGFTYCCSAFSEQPYASCSHTHTHTHASVTKQYMLTLITAQWCAMAGRVTINLASQWTRVTGFSGLSIYGSRPKEATKTPHLHSSKGYGTLYSPVLRLNSWVTFCNWFFIFTSLISKMCPCSQGKCYRYMLCRCNLYRLILVLGYPPPFFQGQELKVDNGAYVFFSKASLQVGLRKIKETVTHICGMDASLIGRS